MQNNDYKPWCRKIQKHPGRDLRRLSSVALSSRHLWILCLFPVAEINTRSPNIAHNLVESSRGWGGGSGVGPAENASPFFAAFCDSRKTLEKMVQPSHPCLKPGLHYRQFLFSSPVPSSRLGCLALACAPKPVWPPDDTACLLPAVFVINVYMQKVSFAAIFVSWMKVSSVNQFNILFY